VDIHGTPGILIGRSIQSVIQQKQKIMSRHILAVEPQRRGGFVNQPAGDPAGAHRRRGRSQAFVEARQGDAGLKREAGILLGKGPEFGLFLTR
jgi:hypothetical protein